ncbi:DNA-binding transcriptional regulator, MarR family [Streptomyces sp. DvalAA-14]|uniref:MarR family winged helix-turn-helix transcriptional regulator n=1 Tax=unclassified Streptomyces TaxID=2593676 RepID=UPI00081B1C88|nr:MULTISPECIES: MarR family transcriptional regulator [unclassified Streptomyces]MYS23905.1 MarR family transcriptional regulator [Streptomyces sp. SID4948]SCE40182.1 DNA-binding transcriptional regulator, MarR family [Streptomyces sp. DvalAA-14]
MSSEPSQQRPPEPSYDLAHLLSHAERRLVQRLAAVLAAEGCAVEQWRVLSAVADGAGHPMTEIAEYALLPAPSLTKLVDRMVADNLVYRRPDPGDRRRVLLHLAARGRILHQRAAHRVAEDRAALRAALPADPDELARSLAELVEALGGLGVAGPPPAPAVSRRPAR